MDKCNCGSMTDSGFKHLGAGQYVCCYCHGNVTRRVMDMFFSDPWGTVKLVVRKKKGAK